MIQRSADSRIRFDEDHSRRINPSLMNRLLQEAVPVLKHTGWEIKKVGQGFAETVLPLNAQTTNQHGTHQAALISLSADYTGGMALTTLLTGVPLAGIHKCKSDNSASLWLASMDVRYTRPSTGHLTATCHIEPAVQKKIRDRYFQGRRVLVALPIRFRSNDTEIATATLKYFAQPTSTLQRAGTNSSLFSQKLKASARMIAGVRATGDPENEGIHHDVIAAGPHGELLARRLINALPQLAGMIRARTRSIDSFINDRPGAKQVVLLGAGLDMRPFRMKRRRGIRFFEVDLPPMIEERNRIIAGMQPDDSVERFSVTADFLTDDVAEQIRNQSPFDPTCETLFVFEGCSMYFSREQNQRILQSAWSLAGNRQSRIWFDSVSTAVIERASKSPAIDLFLDRMEDLGEEFVFGTDQPDQLATSIGCGTSSTTRSSETMEDPDPVFDCYSFTVGSH